MLSQDAYLMLCCWFTSTGPAGVDTCPYVPAPPANAKHSKE